MEITTIIGLAGGLACLVISILLGGSISAFYDLPSVFITIGGTVASTLLSFPGKVLKSLGSVAKNIFRKKKIDYLADIEMIIQMAGVARREGLLALENRIDDMRDDFVKKGIMLIVDGADPEFIRDVLETEIHFMQQRHESGQSIFETMASYSPAFGMIGTLIGLINMLRKIEDPSAIGPDMAVALVTTFYGVVLAFSVFTPIAKKLKILSEDESLQKEMLLEGMLSIQSGENPRLIRDKLMSFVSKSKRRAIEQQEDKTALKAETKEIVQP